MCSTQMVTDLRLAIATVIAYALIACGGGDAIKPSASPSVTATGSFAVRGRVFDSSSSTPIANANIYVRSGQDANGSSGRYAQTDAAGGYELANRAPGPIRIEVGAIGYNASEQTLTLTSDATLDFTMTKYVPPM